ncbi:MAG: extracellular solute-binding protein [Oscillospiraceae bacterium]|jgi:putative aldouronate transport system substrate-binding protein|nr:extracellular solute-binding protein [Oscillospiraceae bacterium]
MKKLLTLVLALTMLLTLSLPVFAQAGAANSITIKIPVYDRGFEGWNVTDNYYTQWIQKEFGDPNGINVQFVAITRSAEVQDYMQMLAAGTAPDIVFHYDMPQAVAYQAEGAIQPLNLDELKEYAPTYYERTIGMVEQYGELDGETYFFFAKRPDAYNWLTLIREDWCEAVGKPLPTTLAELNELVLLWRDAGLGYLNHQLVKDNYTYSYPFRAWPNDDKEHALYSELGVADFTWAATHDYLKNLNYQYNAGVIDPEFYLCVDTNEAMSWFVSGRAGTYSLYLASASPVISSLLANFPDAKLATLDPRSGSPNDGYSMERGYWPFGMIMGINASTNDATRVAVWKYLEWMLQDGNLFKLENGVEGENYTVAENGLAIATPDFAGASVLSANKNKDMWCLWEESAAYPTQELQEVANLINWAPVGYEQLILDSKKFFEEMAPYRVPDALFTTAVTTVAEYKADLNTLWQELYVKCVMASEADFEKVYEESCKVFLESGYQAILDQKAELYDAGKVK